MRLSELQNKNIVKINDGKMIGNIIDIDINSDGYSSGKKKKKTKFFISRFSSSGEFIVKWNQIEKIGEDVILVNMHL